MPTAQANGIEIAYETLGDPGDPALLMIMGLGAQLTTWPVELCQLLVEQGFHLVMFDNRDCGLSTVLDHLGPADLSAALGGDAPYSIADLAADTAGLLDALGLRQVHLIGASMGGMVAQQFVIDYPDRVLSLCSVMSTTGDRSVGTPSPEALAAMSRPPATSRAEAVENGVAASKVIGSPDYPVSDDERRLRAVDKYDRAYTPYGTARQVAAIFAAPDRTAALGAVSVPTLVIHGEADPLVDVSGGRATAAAIPGAELLLVPGMGHDLPRPLWPRIASAIVKNARR